MKNNKSNNGQPKRRFCKATDGPVIMQRYSRMPTAELALEMGLATRQITDFVYRQNSEAWASKDEKHLSKMNSKNGKRGGRPRRKS